MTRIRLISQACLIVAMSFFLTGSSDTSARYASLGHKMMCTCGCNQVLIECNHVGCQSSRRMLGELQISLNQGDSDVSILKAFQAEYGPIAMAVPMFTPFNRTVWIAPPLFLAVGAGIVVLLARKWIRRPSDRPLKIQSTELLEVRNRIRKETEL
jgi:cytochrome c-type biogenesis protein CcmH/NrfF